MPPEAMVRYLRTMPPRAISVSMVLLQQGPGRCPWSGLPPGTILIFKNYAMLAFTFTSCSTLESRSPHPESIINLALVTGIFSELALMF